MPRCRLSLLPWWTVSLLVLGCTGSISGVSDSPSEGRPQPDDGAEADDSADPIDGTPDGSLPSGCGAKAVSDVPTRLLTTPEINAMLFALLPRIDLEPVVMERDSRVGSFLLNTREAIEAGHVRDFRQMAERVAAAASADPTLLFDCASTPTEQSRCAKAFVLQTAARAFRRPLSEAKQQTLLALFDAGHMADGVRGGLRYSLEGILQAPSFMYLYENVIAGTGGFDLSPHEIAQRLAITFMRSIPDAALLTDAASGRLARGEVRAEHARRLMNSARGRKILRDLVMQGLGLDLIEKQGLGALSEGQTLGAAMAAEAHRLIDHVIENEGGAWPRLLTLPLSFADETLAKHHSVDVAKGEAISDGVWKFSQPARPGLLNQTAFLSLNHGPVHRGLAVQERILCGEVPGPEGIDVTAIPTFPGESERSKSEKRLAAAGCGACHALMDSLGLSFEIFDDLGRLRSKDAHGNAVSGAGEISGTETSDGPVIGPGQLMLRLAQSPEAQRCAARKIFVWTFGRKPAGHDEPHIDRITAALGAADDRLPEALTAVVLDDSFARGCVIQKSSEKQL